MEYDTLPIEYSQSEDGREGEMEIDLQLPDDAEYDVDESDGTIIVQWWRGEEQ